ncbi:MAG: nucleotidyltransferase family protein [Clostridia bacterium]|nr:nucleotidyltransferase family protein [Clostridia bacterium]
MIHWIYARPLFPFFVSLVVFTILYAFLNLIFSSKKWIKVFNFLLFVLSVLAILQLTVFSRNGNVIALELRPFYSFIEAQKQPEMYRSVLMNWALYLPFGIALPYVLSKSFKKINVLFTVLSAFILSVFVEWVQFYLSLGKCETDDVIFNTLGAVTGALGYLLYGFLKGKETKMKEASKNLQTAFSHLCSFALFGKETQTKEFKAGEILKEANRQTVYPLVCTALEAVSGENYTAEPQFLQRIAENMRVSFDHSEIHRALSEKGIKYVAFKGVASAKYYKEPLLRTMGDTDILVYPKDIKVVNSALEKIGYKALDSLEKDHGHIAFIRKKGEAESKCEVHFSVGGIPENKAEVFSKYLNVIENAELIKTQNGECLVPSKFHHGVILLLHTATHLIREGVGLRHLCDWAVFINSVSEAEMTETFEGPLKEMGLWEFARILTAVCVEYLGCEKKVWVENVEKSLLENVFSDIFSGGNFGTKDADRYTQIKYIADRKDGSVDRKNPILQVFKTLTEKTRREVKFVKEHPVLLPFGVVYTSAKYLFLVATKKRKADSIKTINDAKHRKDIYSEFKLFE